MGSMVQQSTSAALRPRVLRAMADGALVTQGQLRVQLGVQAGQLRRLIGELVADGLVEERGHDDRRSMRFALTPEGVAYATAIASQSGLGGDTASNMWRTARAFRSFSPLDLMALSSTDAAPIDKATAKAFCALLLRGGYVRVTRKAKPGINEAFYRLVRDTGPKPPVERRMRVVFDQNEEQVVHVPGGGL